MTNSGGAATAAPPSPAGGPLPDASGHFGRFGGRLAPEALMSALAELTQAYEAAQADPGFQAELAALATGYAGRPTLLQKAASTPACANTGSSSSVCLKIAR